METPIDERKNLLHNHPGTEIRLRIDKNHTVVDRDEWEYVRELLRKGKLAQIPLPLFDKSLDISGIVNWAKVIKEYSMNNPKGDRDYLSFIEWCEKEKYIITKP